MRAGEHAEHPAFRLSLTEAKAAGGQGKTLELVVYDVIGQSFFEDGITAKQVLAQLRSVEASTITVRVNSIGGILDEGKAIYNLLGERVRAGVKVTGVVDGLAASAASVLLMACSVIEMPRNAFVMIHEGEAGMRGRAVDHARVAERINRENMQIAEIYAAASATRGKGKTAAEFLAAMTKTTYFDADQAIEWGLADTITDEIKIAACAVDIATLNEAPEALRHAPYIGALQRQAGVEPPSPLEANDLTKAMRELTTRLDKTTPPTGGRSNETQAHQGKEGSMDIKVLLRALGIAEDADEATAMAAIAELKATHAAAPKSVLKLLGSDSEPRATERLLDLQRLSLAVLGITSASTHEQAIVQINAFKAGNDQSIKLAARVGELDESLRKERLETTIQKLSRDGKLPPARHEWARLNFPTSEALDTFAMGLGTFPSEGPHEPNTATVALTAEERNICRQTGVAETDFLAQRKLEREQQAARQAAAGG